MRFFRTRRAFGAMAIAAVLGTSFIAGAPAAKADMAGLSLGLADAACRAMAASESYGVYQQYPDVGIETFWAVYWTCRYGG